MDTSKLKQNTAETKKIPLPFNLTRCKSIITLVHLYTVFSPSLISYTTGHTCPRTKPINPPTERFVVLQMLSVTKFSKPTSTSGADANTPTDDNPDMGKSRLRILTPCVLDSTTSLQYLAGRSRDILWVCFPLSCGAMKICRLLHIPSTRVSVSGF